MLAYLTTHFTIPNKSNTTTFILKCLKQACCSTSPKYTYLTADPRTVLCAVFLSSSGLSRISKKTTQQPCSPTIFLLMTLKLPQCPKDQPSSGRELHQQLFGTLH